MRDDPHNIVARCRLRAVFASAIPLHFIAAFQKGLSGDEVADATALSILDHHRSFAVERHLKGDANPQGVVSQRLLKLVEVEDPHGIGRWRSHRPQSGRKQRLALADLALRVCPFHAHPETQRSLAERMLRQVDLCGKFVEAEFRSLRSGRDHPA